MRLALFLLGFVMIFGGIGGITSEVMGGAMSTTQRAMEMATSINPTTLCGNDETLVEEKGASSYTPGQGSASPVRYYCENEDNMRREVTGEFAEQTMSDLSSLIDPSTFLSFRREWIYLIVAGIVLLFVAPFLGGRRRSPTVIVGGGGDYPAIMVNNRRVASSDMGSAIQEAINAAQQQRASMSTGGTSGGGDLSEKLRQLDAAKSSGLISESEYQRARQKLLDELT